MKFNQKHLMVLLASITILIVSTISMGYLQKNTVYRNTMLEMKNEGILLDKLRDLTFGQYMETAVYLGINNYAFQYEDFSPSVYYANTSNYREIFGKYHLKNIDKIKIDAGYKSRYPLDNPKIAQTFPSMKKDYPPNIVAVTLEDKIISYFYIDGRLADLSKIDQNSGGNSYVSLGEDQRLVLTSEPALPTEDPETEKNDLE